METDSGPAGRERFPSWLRLVCPAPHPQDTPPGVARSFLGTVSWRSLRESRRHGEPEQGDRWGSSSSWTTPAQILPALLVLLKPTESWSERCKCFPLRLLLPFQTPPGTLRGSRKPPSPADTSGPNLSVPPAPWLICTRRWTHTFPIPCGQCFLCCDLNCIQQ